MPLTVGTAGHIDHGKTWLVRALTGKDTDRLPEEKERGISIDLGYAPLDLPDGTRLSLIDVPGHERFIRNMVAGASGIDLFLLVIDATEGARPQTHEHLAILRLLGIEHGVVAVTKADAADPETLELVVAEARELVPGAPVIRRQREDRRGAGRAPRRARSGGRGGSSTTRCSARRGSTSTEPSRCTGSAPSSRARSGRARSARATSSAPSRPGSTSACGASRCTTSRSSAPRPVSGSRSPCPGSSAARSTAATRSPSPAPIPSATASTSSSPSSSRSAITRACTCTTGRRRLPPGSCGSASGSRSYGSRRRSSRHATTASSCATGRRSEAAACSTRLRHARRIAARLELLATDDPVSIVEGARARAGPHRRARGPRAALARAARAGPRSRRACGRVVLRARLARAGRARDEDAADAAGRGDAARPGRAARPSCFRERRGPTRSFRSSTSSSETARSISPGSTAGLGERDEEAAALEAKLVEAGLTPVAVDDAELGALSRSVRPARADRRRPGDRHRRRTRRRSASSSTSASARARSRSPGSATSSASPASRPSSCSSASTPTASRAGSATNACSDGRRPRDNDRPQGAAWARWPSWSSKPVRSCNPRLGRFDSCAAP